MAGPKLGRGADNLPFPLRTRRPKSPKRARGRAGLPLGTPSRAFGYLALSPKVAPVGSNSEPGRRPLFETGLLFENSDALPIHGRWKWYLRAMCRPCSLAGETLDSPLKVLRALAAHTPGARVTMISNKTYPMFEQDSARLRAAVVNRLMTGSLYVSLARHRSRHVRDEVSQDHFTPALPSEIAWSSQRLWPCASVNIQTGEESSIASKMRTNQSALVCLFAVVI